MLGNFLPRRRVECGVEYQPQELSYHETYRAIRGTNAANFRLKAAEQTFLKIEVLDAQCVLLDELASWFNNITHQLGKEVIRLGHVLNPDL